MGQLLAQRPQWTAAGVVFVFGFVDRGEAAERELEFALRGVVRLRRRDGLRGIWWLRFGSHGVEGLASSGLHLVSYGIRAFR